MALFGQPENSFRSKSLSLGRKRAGNSSDMEAVANYFRSCLCSGNHLVSTFFENYPVGRGSTITFRHSGLEEDTLCISVSSWYLRKETNTSSKPMLGLSS